MELYISVLHRITRLINGLAERFVQTLKQALRKLNCDGDNIKANLQKAFFHYRVMPHQETGKSPSEMMFGKNVLDWI